MTKWILSLLMVTSVAMAEMPATAEEQQIDAQLAEMEKSATAQAVAEKAPVEAAKAETKATVAKKEVSLDEAEIPLNLDGKKAQAASDSSMMRIIMILSILGIMGTGAFVLIRRKAQPGGIKSATQIKVLSQHFLGPKKSLAIVRVAGESILIGVTDQNISMIKSLSLLDDEIPEETPANFGNVLSNLGLGKKNQQETVGFTEESDEFAIKGIKDVVSKRLKNMRSIE